MLDVTRADLTKVYDLSRKMLNIYKKEILDQKIDASGKLLKTANFDVDFQEYSLSVYFILEGYWYYVEHGRKPSTGKWGSWSTKLKDIETWLQNKISKGYFIPRAGHTIPRTPKEIRSVSFCIARKITKFGYYNYSSLGKHPLETAMEEAESLGIIDEIIDSVFDAFDGRVTAEFMKI